MDPDIKSFLNYIAFFILYLVSFYFSYKNTTEIIGLTLLFITNTSFLLFLSGQIFPKLTNANSLMNFNLLSVVIGLILHFISLLFVIIAVLHLQQKFANIEGTPFILPINEKKKLNNFKYNMILSFIIGIILMLTIYNNEKIINTTSFSDIFLNLNSDRFIPIFSLLCSISIYVLSFFQLKPTYDIMLIPKKFIAY